MKIIHYYTGRQVSDDELNRARVVRLDRNTYLFRDAAAWDGVLENVDKVVSSNDAIVRAYADKGIGQFDLSPYMPRKPEPVVPVVEKPRLKRGRPKRTEEAAVPGGDPEVSVDLTEGVEQ